LACSTLAFAALVLIVSAVGGWRLHEVPLAALVATYFLFLWWLGRWSRFRHLRRVRVTLGAMPPAARANLLRSVSEDRIADTRAIAQALMREFGVPTELAPAAGPGARGEEPTPAEEAR